jgi:hypothetical protein
MNFPEDTKVGDMFWLNDEPVRVTAWNYLYGPPHSYYFDLDFVDITREGRPSAGMILIPMGFDFYGAEIRKMSSLELELF